MGNSIDWGTVPDWVAAVGSVLAVAFSAAIAFKEMRARKAAEDKLHAQSLQSMRSDGEAFVTWLEGSAERIGYRTAESANAHDEHRHTACV